MNRLPASQRHRRHDRRWKRYEKPLPGHRVQVDVKFIEPVEIGAPDRLSPRRRKRYYQYTAIDDCTRIRVLKIFDRNNQTSAIRFIDYVFEKLPFRVEVVQTDIHGWWDGSVQASIFRPRINYFLDFLSSLCSISATGLGHRVQVDGTQRAGAAHHPRGDAWRELQKLDWGACISALERPELLP